MRAVIYAHSAVVDQKAIKDQLDQCGNLALRENLEIVNRFSDNGPDTNISAIRAILQSAAEGRFDVVLATDLARFSRDTEERFRILKELKSHGVRIITDQGDVEEE